MATAVDTIHLVEASAHLREAQKNLLCGPNAKLTESETGWHSICKHTGRPIIWTETIQSVPKRKRQVPVLSSNQTLTEAQPPPRCPSYWPTSSLTPFPSTPSNVSKCVHREPLKALHPQILLPPQPALLNPI